jgi:GTP cyclohydrolase IA
METNDKSRINTDVIEKNFKEIMEKGLGLDMTDPNFVDTPKRFAKSYAEIFAGLEKIDTKIHDIFKTSFPTHYNGIVLEKGLTVFSMCPHHFLPIRYEVTIGYIPDGQALGLSKLARIIELMARKPCLQEDFTETIVEEINEHLDPLGVIIIVKGAHFCMRMRGVEQKDSWTTTSSVRGVFLGSREMELKFYNLIKDH